MKPLKQAFIHILLTLTVALSQKSSDESRPYEFGFTIDGEQHRHEKKDQNGIVQGEFGFITADGVYHVTVYATDENGKFRILSMRNIRISAPLDGSPATGPISPEAGKYLGKQKQIGSISSSSTSSPVQPQQPIQPQRPLQPQRPIQPQPPPQQYPQPSGPSLQQPPGPQLPQSSTEKPKVYEFTTQSTIKPACGGCGYVTTSKPVNGQPFPFQNPAFQNQPNGGNGAIPPSDVQNVQTVQGGSSGFVQSPLGVQYQQQPGGVQQNLPNQLQGSLQNTQTGNHFGQSSTPSPVISQLQYGQNEQQNVQPPLSSINNQQSFGQGTSNPGQLPGTNLLSTGFNQGTNSQQGSTGQNAVNTQSYQNGGIRNEQEYGLFGSLNKGANGHIQSPATSGTEFVPLVPNPPAQNGGVSALPPVSVSGNTIHVAGNKPVDIPIKDKYPGMSDGLPDGVEEKDIKDLLYKFHYTVGFHGHYEKGLKNGAKIGGYFVNGRDGFSRVVTYIADENGYRPKFKFINLGLDSEDTPKEGSEKKYGLKSFEFVWYPIQ